MDTHPDARLKVDVKLLGEPCLWCWEIVDTERGALVESSWTSQWTAYESSRDALWAGSLRLAELSRRSRGALLPRSGAAGVDRAGRPPGSPPGRV